MKPKKTYTRSIPSMASHLDITLVLEEGQDKEAMYLTEQGFAEANRLIRIISAWQEDTELAAVNRNAGIQPVAVCDELFYLIRRSIKISELTGGLFDVTFASLDKIWFFDKPMTRKPDPEAVRASVRNIGYRFIELDETRKTIFISNKGTKIELGAIGKGFIANKIKRRLELLGVTSGLVNAGGDLVTWGANEKGEMWKVGVCDPAKKEKYIAWLPVMNKAIATSGSYERFAIIDGEKYSHIIHPATGYPVKGIHSVTIISDDAELSDAIATSVFLLGLEQGMDFIDRFSDIRGFIVDENEQYHYSANLKTSSYAVA